MANANSSSARSQSGGGKSAGSMTLSRRKADGVFYTPDSIVRYIVQQTLSPLLAERTEGLPPLRVLDPACGDGAFLVEVSRFLAAREEGLQSNQDAMPLSTIAVERRLRVIRDHIFGVDIDRHAVAAAKRRLARLAIGIDTDEYATTAVQQRSIERLARRLAGNIRCGDALLGPEFFLNDGGTFKMRGEGRTAPFAWSRDFAHVLDHGGFDSIVGNPPYVNIRLLGQSRGDAMKEYFCHRYQCARGAYDMYVLFLEKAFELLRVGGTCGMIVPNKIAALDYAKSCRGMLLEQTTLMHITDVARLGLFPSVSVYPYVLNWKKEIPSFDHMVAIHHPNSESELQTPKPAIEVHQSSFSPETGFRIHGELDVESRVPTQPLASRAMLHSGTTGFVARQIAAALLEFPVAGDEPCFEFIVTGNIDRYSIRPGNVRYMNQRYQQPMLPMASEELSANKRRLFAGPKIVVAGMTRRLEAAFDTGNRALGVQVFAAADPQDDPRYLLGLLNSKLLSYLFRIRFQAKRLANGYLAVNKSQLAQLPIRVVDDEDPVERSLYDQIVAGVDKITALHLQLAVAAEQACVHDLQGQIDRCDAEIDDCVYDLYRVTEDERLAAEAIPG
ncbi:MAG TPA: Eco57I restriction-modification methylase domain-containing protein [Pirellulaceae bacterium]|jgi:hypothetical protein|nr:Eco57I restriction-modification methylase domain-containing protein [Pirellulaceae bacterium]